MVMREWDDLPEEMKTPEVRKYYDILAKRTGSLIAKRLFDIAASVVLLDIFPFRCWSLRR